MPDAIKEHPINFSAPMVRATLDGRKTQARRVVKPQPISEYTMEDGTGAVLPVHYFDPVDDYFVPSAFGQHMKYMDEHLRIKCPYGVPGDRLWVKEVWQSWAQGMMWREDEPDVISGWMSARSMPRWAARLILEITDVRVQWLQDISEEDVKAEGIQTLPLQDTKDPSAWWQSAPGEHQARSAKQSFALLWDSIAKPGEKWDDNPWVWVISFRKVDHA